MARKITYIISRVDKALEFEWVVEFLDPTRFELSFIILNPTNESALTDYAESKGLKVKRINYSSQKSFIPALIKTWITLIKWRPEIVNCHLPEGTLIGLLAAKLCGIKKRLYTRHHSTLNHDYHPHAIKYDRWSNVLATNIIAVSGTVKKVLIEKENVNPEKVMIVEHCLDMEKFQNVSENQVETVIDRNEIPKGRIIIGVVARYTKWKGIQYIIEAFSQLIEENTDVHLVLANARKGDYVDEIIEQLSHLPKGSFTEIEFEKDLYALHKAFDFFVHTPIDSYSEAFGQIYIEALASKTPSVFSYSGIGNDILIDGTNSIVVPHKNSKAIYQGLLKLIQDQHLCKSIANNGYSMVVEKFPISRKIEQLEGIYSR